MASSCLVASSGGFWTLVSISSLMATRPSISTLSVTGSSDIVGGFPRQPIYFTASNGGFFDRPRVDGNTVIGNDTAFADGTGERPA